MTRDERTEAFAKIMHVAKNKLIRQKVEGVSYSVIAESIGVAKTRISEIVRLHYMGRKTLALLVRHNYLSVSDIEAAGLSSAQLSEIKHITGLS